MKNWGKMEIRRAILQHCLLHDLLISKLHAYGLDMDSLKIIYTYLCRRKKRVEINHKYPLYKIWENTRFNWPVFFRIRTKCTIVCLAFFKAPFWGRYFSKSLYVTFFYLQLIKISPAMLMILLVTRRHQKQI